LTEIGAENSQTVTLDATHSNPTSRGLYAKLTENKFSSEIGSFKFTGISGQSVEVGNVNSDYTGTTEVTGTNFTVTAVSDNAFGKTSELKVETGAKVDFQNHSQTVGGLDGNGEIVLGDFTVNPTTGDSTFAGKLTGDGSLTKTGDKKLTLSSTNTYEGETNINVGILALTGTGSIAESEKVTVAGNATFDVSDVTTNASVKELQGSAAIAKVVLGTKRLSVAKGSFNGEITGNGGLTKSDSGTADNTLTLSGTNTYTGETTINAGTLELTGTGSIAESEKVTVAGNATFDVSGVTITASVKDLQASATTANVVLGTEGLSVAKGSFNGEITGNGGLTKSNSGTADNTLTLSGTNTYEGATNINAGTLALTGNGSIAQSSGVTLVTGTIFDIIGITNKTSIQALNGNGTVTLDTKELEVGQGNFAGTITGTGIFTKNTDDTLTLTNNAPFTNASKIKINEGTLALDRSLENEAEYTFNQKLLAGTGTLEVTLGNKTDEFKLGGSVGNEFTGTVSLTTGTIELDGLSDDNVISLENATLKLSTNSVVDLKQSSTIGDLITNGGTVQFTTTEISPNAKLTVDKLDISGGVTLDLSATITNGIVTLPLAKQSFFDYADDNEYLQQQLIAAENVTSNSNKGNINLLPPENAEQTRTIKEGGDDVGRAKFDYTASLKKDGNGTENGVYLGYGLTEIEAYNDKTVTLDATGSTTNRLDARLIGEGGFKFTGRDSNRSVEVGNVNSNYTGTTTVTTTIPGTNFTVNAVSDNAFGNTSELTVNDGATVDFKTYAQTVGGLAGNGKITNGNLTVDTDKGTGDSTFDGTLNGTSSLTKEGDDTLTLSGKNNYEGETTINEGTLALTGNGSIAKSNKVTVAGNAAFDIQNVTTNASVKNLQSTAEDADVILGNKELSVEQGSFAGNISGNGILTKTGTISDTLTLSGKNTDFTGETNIKNGTLALTGNGSIAHSSKVNVDGTLDIKGITNTAAQVQELTGNSNGKVDLGNKELEIAEGSFAGNISGNGKLTKTETDTLTLSGTNTYSGATDIKNGILELSGTINKTSNINVAENAVLDVKGNKTLNNLESAGTVTFNSGLNLAGDNSTTINGLDGNADVTKTGTGTTTLGDNTVKKFVQQKGNVVLDGNLTGDYEQAANAGDFVAGTTSANTVTIDGSAQFNSNVQLKSRLNADNLTLGNNSTLNVDFTQFTDPSNAIIKVEGLATMNGNAIFNLKQYVPGETSKTYELLSADTLSGTFKNYTVTFDGQEGNNRQGYKIDSQDNSNNNSTILHLTAFTQNQSVTRSAGGQWSNSQWIGSDDYKFYNGDYVTLNGSGNQTMTIDGNVETAGMKITSGKWTFSGDSITGKTQTGYGADSLPPDNNKGALTVTGNNTAVTFNNPITFADIAVTEKAKLNLPGESSVNTGTFTVDKDAQLTLQAIPNKVTATGDVNINGNFQLLYETDPTQNKTIANIIKTTGGTISGNFAADISDKLLSSAKTQIVNQNQLDLVYTTPGVGGFAASNGLSGNIARIGNLIDTQNYADSKLLQELYGLDKDEPEKFEQILFNQLGPELAADALQMNLWKPYLKIFYRLHENGNTYRYRASEDPQDNVNNQNNIRGQNSAKTNYEFWFEGYYRDENVSQDAFAGSYKSSRPGMLIGMESHLLHPFRAGMFFGYGKPRVFNEIGRVEANDLTFGIYSRSQFGTKLFLNAFFAYGNQDYEYQHNGVRSSYSGEAIYASLELFHTTLRKDNSQLQPLFAIDFQNAWMDGFTANDTAQKIDKSEIDQIVLRFGMNSKFQPKEFLSFRTRLQYGVLISGDTYGAVRTSYLSNPDESRMLTGVNRGRNMFNVGVGLNIYDCKFKHSRFFADYDFDLSERSTAHTGQLGLVIGW
jgi:autotransporter-associated beta strand protein